MSFYRHLLRAICFVLSLYLIGVEFGVDFSESLDKKLATDCSGLVEKCEQLLLPIKKSDWIYTDTKLEENVSNLR